MPHLHPSIPASSSDVRGPMSVMGSAERIIQETVWTTCLKVLLTQHAAEKQWHAQPEVGVDVKQSSHLRLTPLAWRHAAFRRELHSEQFNLSVHLPDYKTWQWGKEKSWIMYTWVLCERVDGETQCLVCSQKFLMSPKIELNVRHFVFYKENIDTTFNVVPIPPCPKLQICCFGSRGNCLLISYFQRNPRAAISIF